MARNEFMSEGASETIVQPSGARAGRLSGLLLTAVSAAALGYAWYVQHRAQGPANAASEPFNTARTNQNFEFDKAPPPKTDNRLVLTPPVSAPPPAPAPTIVVAPAPGAAVAQDDGEAKRLEEERRAAAAREQARLKSDMLIVKNGGADLGGTQASASGVAIKSQAQYPEDDANRKFLANGSSEDLDVAKALPDARPDALVTTGTMIRGVLETAIQSDLAGQIKAITSEDVYSYDGRRVLIPRGSTLIGEYRSGLTRGQTRLFVIWTSLRAAAFNGHEGYHVALGSYGTDALGRSGLTGDLDEHYVQRFGAAILLSIVGGASSFLAGLNSAGQSVTTASGTTVLQQAQTQAQQTTSQTMSDLANQALKDSINIPPTIFVDQGTPIIVFVKRDLDFSTQYLDPVKEALYELRHPARTGTIGR